MTQKYSRVFEVIERQVLLESFDKYVVHSEQHRNELVFNIRTGKTKGLPRFNVWRLFLEILPFSQKWEEKIAKLGVSRNRWNKLRQQFRNINKPSTKQGPLAIPKNPLMKATVKLQKKEESDSFLSEQIKKDVERTYQQITFFQDQDIIRLLSNVLFVWCKGNPDVSYKQGMNELLASIVWVYFHEAVPVQFDPSDELEKKYKELNSLQYAEADVYSVFEKIMEIQKEMFRDNLDTEVKGTLNPNSKINSPILIRIGQLEEVKLKFLDIDLYRALKLQDVKTRSFLLRWIRCLHTREFGLIGSLPIWDSIILESFEYPASRNRKQFFYIDSMCLAMFIYMRSVVLTLQTAGQITRVYQKYPALEGQALMQLLGLSWSICEELRSQKEEDFKEQPSKNTIKQPAISPQVIKVQKIIQSSPKKSEEPPKKRQQPQYPNKNDNSKKISIQSTQLQQMIAKLSQSNTYNQDSQSKKLVRWVIQKLQSKLAQPE